MKKLLKISLIVLLLVIVGGFFTFNSILKKGIQEYASKELGLETTINSLTLNPLTGKINSKGILIKEDDKTLLALDSFKFESELGKIIKGDIYINEITLIKPIIDIDAIQSYSERLESKEKGTVATTSSSVSTTGASSESTEKDSFIKSIEVKSIKVEELTVKTKEAALKSLDTITLEVPKLKFENDKLDLNANLEIIGSGVINLVLNLDSNSGDLDGSLNIPSLNLKNQITYEERDIHIEAETMVDMKFQGNYKKMDVLVTGEKKINNLKISEKEKDILRGNIGATIDKATLKDIVISSIALDDFYIDGDLAESFAPKEEAYTKQTISTTGSPTSNAPSNSDSPKAEEIINLLVKSIKLTNGEIVYKKHSLNIDSLDASNITLDKLNTQLVSKIKLDDKTDITTDLNIILNDFEKPDTATAKGDVSIKNLDLSILELAKEFNVEIPVDAKGIISADANIDYKLEDIKASGSLLGSNLSVKDSTGLDVAIGNINVTSFNAGILGKAPIITFSKLSGYGDTIAFKDGKDIDLSLGKTSFTSLNGKIDNNISDIRINGYIDGGSIKFKDGKGIDTSLNDFEVKNLKASIVGKNPEITATGSGGVSYLVFKDGKGVDITLDNVLSTFGIYLLGEEYRVFNTSASVKNLKGSVDKNTTINIPNIEASLKKVDPRDIEVNSVVVSSPQIRATRVEAESSGSTDSTSTDSSSKPQSSNTNKDLPYIYIGSIKVNNGTFTDILNGKENKVNDINFSASKVTSKANSPFSFKGSGSVVGITGASADGTVTLAKDWEFDPKTMKFKGSVGISSVALSTFSPLLNQALPNTVENGSLKLTGNIDLNKGIIAALNDVTISGLELGSSTGNAKSVPLKQLVDTLSDDSGNLNLSVPINGDLNDPNFGIKSIVASTVATNLKNALKEPEKISSIVTGALTFGKEASDNIVYFDYTKSTLKSNELEKLARLKKLLKSDTTKKATLTLHTNDKVEDGMLIGKDVLGTLFGGGSSNSRGVEEVVEERKGYIEEYFKTEIANGQVSVVISKKDKDLPQIIIITK